MKKSFIIILHTGYWILYLLLILLFSLFINAGLTKSFSHNNKQLIGFLFTLTTLTLLPAVISFYFFYGPLFNKFLSKRKMLPLCIWALIVVLLAGFTGLIGIDLVTSGVIFANNGFKEMSILMGFLSLLSLIHGIIALVVKGFVSWYGDIKIKEELQQKNFQTELALVKSQLNPHFLFNTINNIDVLIEKDPVNASAYLNQLSDIMRFMLYETKTEKIPLQKELVYIEKYIALQRIRSANENFILLEITGDPNGWMIAPMLFIPFIENAFKHSLNKKTGPSIMIRIQITATQLAFDCTNFFVENPVFIREAGGVGNDLIRRRLNLLYPFQHSLTVIKETDLYKLNLVIQK